MYPRVTGFVKSIGVDRGSRVRAGEVLATLEAPELSAQRAEAQSKVQAANAQLAATRAKADADASTYDRLKAASATPGVVAGNDLVVAQKAVEADRSQIAAAEQNVEAARQALQSVSDMEGYLKVVAPFDGVVTERNVHPGALVGPAGGAGAPPMLRLMKNDRLRLVVPVPEAYVADVRRGATLTFTVPAYPGQDFVGHDRARRAGGRRQDADDGRRARRRQSRRPSRGRDVLPGALARPSRHAVVIRSFGERREHDGSNVCHTDQERQGRVGRREDRPDVGPANRGVRRPAGGR